jgi:hypothetical protein
MHFDFNLKVASHLKCTNEGAQHVKMHSESCRHFEKHPQSCITFKMHERRCVPIDEVAAILWCTSERCIPIDEVAAILWCTSERERQLMKLQPFYDANVKLHAKKAANVKVHAFLISLHYMCHTPVSKSSICIYETEMKRSDG